MTKRILFLLIILTVSMTVSRVVTGQSEEEAIKNFIADYVKVLNSGDSDGIIDFFVPDAVFMPHGAPAQVGEKAIHAFFQNMLSQESNDLKFDPVEVVVLDGWAFSRTEVTGTTTSKDDGTSTKIDNKSLFVLSRDSGGTWKIARLMWNMNGES